MYIAKVETPSGNQYIISYNLKTEVRTRWQFKIVNDQAKANNSISSDYYFRSEKEFRAHLYAVFKRTFFLVKI